MLQRLIPVLAAGGPLDVIGNAPVGVLAEDLRAAALLALQVPRDNCRAFAMRHSWDESARLFLANIRDAVAVPASETSAGVTIGGEHSSVAA